MQSVGFCTSVQKVDSPLSLPAVLMLLSRALPFHVPPPTFHFKGVFVHV